MNRIAGSLLLMLAALLGGGCATSGPDWNQRVGSYTYDQAVEDMGRPLNFSKTADNSIIAEWLTKRGYSSQVEQSGAQGRSDQPYSYRSGYPTSPATGGLAAQNHFLKLVFGPDLKLQSWEQLNR